MDVVLRHRGRAVSREDVAFIRKLIEQQPASRRALSIDVCKAWDWVQPNSALRDAVCRQLLLELHRGGHIELPAPQWTSTKKPWTRHKPPPVAVDDTPLETSLRELGPVEIRQVRRTPEEALVNALVEQHHYLGYRQPVGEHLKHLVTAQGRPIACFCRSSAPRSVTSGRRTTTSRSPKLRYSPYSSTRVTVPGTTRPTMSSRRGSSGVPILLLFPECYSIRGQGAGARRKPCSPRSPWAPTGRREAGRPGAMHGRVGLGRALTSIVLGGSRSRSRSRLKCAAGNAAHGGVRAAA